MIEGYASPERILRRLGITEPKEILLEAIAWECGATITPKPMEGCEGRLVGFGSKAIISVNSKSRPERQRFTAGHEIGHWMRHRGNVASACTEEMLTQRWEPDENAKKGGKDPKKRPDLESEANRFAADLLLPLSMFKPRAAKRPITFETVIDLARTFKTSLSATAIRLVEHGSYPAMVLCTGPSGRKWFVRGPDVPEDLFPVRTPGAGSVARALLQRTGPAVPGPTEVDADDWITDEDSERYILTEDSRKVTDDLVLTLLWWEDERQILDLDDD